MERGLQEEPVEYGMLKRSRLLAQQGASIGKVMFRQCEVRGNEIGQGEVQ